MSTNHYSSNQFPDAHLYCSYAHCLMESSSGHSNQKSTFFSTGAYWGGSGGGGSGGGGRFSTTFNLKNEDDQEESGCDDQMNNADTDGERSNLMGMDQFGQDEREPLFEKPLTPSDVGKLNRLVIPKQHAERHFPLSGGGGGGGGDTGEKGFILSFEDEMGKLWRFRYSYWNSSQSYVLTKGWSRFVKEKRLDAGDFVLFSRDRTDFDSLFIGWRKRNSGEGSGVALLAGGRGGGFNRAFYQGNPYPNQQDQGFSQVQQYQQDCLHAGSGSQNQTSGGGNSRRVRLFGVNLECQADGSDPSTPTHGSGHGPYNQSQNYSHHQHHMGWH